MLTFESLNSTSPMSYGNCGMPSISPAAIAAICACGSSMKVNSIVSSGVMPPHHVSLRL